MKYLVFISLFSLLVGCGKSNKSGGDEIVTQEGYSSNPSDLYQKLNQVGLELFFDKYDTRRGLVSGLNCYSVRISNNEVIRQLNIIAESLKGREYLELSGYPRSSKEINFLVLKSIGLFKRSPQDFKCPFKTLYI